MNVVRHKRQRLQGKCCLLYFIAEENGKKREEKDTCDQIKERKGNSQMTELKIKEERGGMTGSSVSERKKDKRIKRKEKQTRGACVSLPRSDSGQWRLKGVS